MCRAPCVALALALVVGPAVSAPLAAQGPVAAPVAAQRPAYPRPDGVPRPRASVVQREAPGVSVGAATERSRSGRPGRVARAAAVGALAGAALGAWVGYEADRRSEYVTGGGRQRRWMVAVTLAARPRPRWASAARAALGAASRPAGRVRSSGPRPRRARHTERLLG
jgi:hypothetical protein